MMIELIDALHRKPTLEDGTVVVYMEDGRYYIGHMEICDGLCVMIDEEGACDIDCILYWAKLPDPKEIYNG